MALQQRVFLHLLLLLGAAGVSGLAAGRASSVIKSTCAAAAQSIWKTPYHYCVEILSADPTAASAADARGVAVAAANLTASNVTSTVRAISDLIESLNHCLNLYREMDAWVTGAVSDLLAGGVETAWPRLSDASYQPGYCRLALMEGNLTPKDPLSDENNASIWLSAMAADIAQAIHDHRTTLP
jgi:pectinesterase inhibitor-like protein